MPNLIPFSFESQAVRVVTHNDGNWSVVAKDVLLALDFSESSLANIPDRISHVPDEWKGRHPIATPGGIQEMWCLAEQGLYFFLNRSDKPKALPLQKWVAGEVLPSIRKTGGYSLPGADAANAILAAQLADLLKGKVLVDYEILQSTVQTLYALRTVFNAVEPLARRIEEQCGRDVLGGLRPASPMAGNVVPRQPVHHGVYKKQSLAETLLDFITAKKSDGAGHRDLQRYCWTYRDATNQERSDALNLLLDQGAIVQVQPEPLPGARRKAVIYVAKPFVKG